MANKAGSMKSKLQRSQDKTSGWTAFDRKQRQKEGIEADIERDPFPSMLTANSCYSNIRNQSPMLKPFASVLQPSLCLRPPPDSSKNGSIKLDSNADHNISQRNDSSSAEWLKQVHDWASKDLIEDILAAAGNDSKHASAILRTMAPVVPKNEKADISLIVSSNVHEDTIVRENSSLFNASDTSTEKPTHKSLPVAPAEPDWDGDDIYLIHRKDAIRMTRMACHHSQAASNSYMRGDHSSAHQLSLKAQEEWKAAEELNAMAAKKILSIQNVKNGKWKLDLHGLHASEAVQALEKHLVSIESEAVINRIVSYDEIPRLAEGLGKTEPVQFLDKEAMDEKLHVTCRQRQKVLHVITGSGNHSQGEAALPTAIRSFLIENGYRFDDARPGVFAVRPKFRRK